MKKIYKYPIEIQDEQVVLLPTGAKDPDSTNERWKSVPLGDGKSNHA